MYFSRKWDTFSGVGRNVLVSGIVVRELHYFQKEVYMLIEKVLFVGHMLHLAGSGLFENVQMFSKVFLEFVLEDCDECCF